MVPLVIGTRSTPLARIQAALVAKRLEQYGVETLVQAMSTRGDRSLGGSFAQSRGVFTGELSAALRDGTVDLVVHSLKDLPVDDEPDLVLAAVPERERPFDLLLLAPGVRARGTSSLADLLGDDGEGVARRAVPASEALAGLPAGARLGTSSPRRQAGALALQPHLVCCAVRGSVGRRLEWLHSGAIDALLAAEAGIVRLARNGALDASDPATTTTRGFRLDLASWPCAPGQGALAVQVLRGGRLDGHPSMARLDHGPTRTAVLAERSLLGRLGGGCLRPFGAWAEVGGGPSGQPSIRAVHAAIAPDDWREAAGAGDAPFAVRAAARAADDAGGVGLDALAARIERGLAEQDDGLATDVHSRSSPPAAGRGTGMAAGEPGARRPGACSPPSTVTGAGEPGVQPLRSQGETAADTPDLIVTSIPTSVRRLTRRLVPGIRAAALPATALDVFDVPWPADRIDFDRPRRQWPWLLVSSPTAARVVAARAAREPIWGRLPWCALGEGTARALLAAGVPPNLTALAADGKGLADYTARVLDPRCRLFVPHSARGGRSLVEALEAVGRDVASWQAYTVRPATDLVWPGGWQAARARVLFTAPSAVAAWTASELDWPGSCWAIGATTAAALLDAGAGNVKCAHEPTAAGIERLWNDEAGIEKAGVKK